MVFITFVFSYWKGVIPLLHFGTYPDSHQSLPQIILQLADPDLLNPEKGNECFT